MNLGDQWPPRCAAAPFEGRRSARRPPSCWPAVFAGSLPVTLLGGFEFFALSLLKLALALLGLGDLFPIFLQRAAVALLNRLPPFGAGTGRIEQSWILHHLARHLLRERGLV